jgi:hypothetical protein
MFHLDSLFLPIFSEVCAMNFDEKLTDIDPMASAIKPKLSVLDTHFAYVPSTKTDVTQTWRKHGWQPLEEVIEAQLKKVRAKGKQ